LASDDQSIDQTFSRRTDSTVTVVMNGEYQAVFFPAFSTAHRAVLCNSDPSFLRLLAAAGSVRLSQIGTTFACAPAFSRSFAQRAFCAAAILARAEADGFLVLGPFPDALQCLGATDRNDSQDSRLQPPLSAATVLLDAEQLGCSKAFAKRHQWRDQTRPAPVRSLACPVPLSEESESPMGGSPSAAIQSGCP
jgi:hypothetical protein